MSLVAPADLDDLLPGVATDLRQALIDRAEAAVADMIGVQTHMEIAAGPDQGRVLEGVTASPLGERTIDRTYTIGVAANLFELPVGPMSSYTTITADGTVVLDHLDTTEILAGPWWLRWPDPSVKWVAYKTVRVEGTIGWTSATLPERVKQAIYQQVTALTQSTEHGGLGVGGEVKSEKLGPFSASYVTAADTSAAGETKQGLPKLEDLLRHWMRPDFGI